MLETPEKSLKKGERVTNYIFITMTTTWAVDKNVRDKSLKHNWTFFSWTLKLNAHAFRYFLVSVWKNGNAVAQDLV